MKNVTIVSASLSVNGNATSISVTLTNSGNVTFRIYGLTLHGEFNATRTWEKNRNHEHNDERIHPDTITFKINGSSLIPLLGTDHEDEHEEMDPGHMALSSLVLEPGQNVTLSFSGVIALHPDKDNNNGPAMVVTPIVGEDYIIRLMGAGFQTFDVTATS